MHVPRKHYVVMVLNESNGVPVRVPSRYWGHCGHIETICAQCADLWEIDYTIWWRNTTAAISLRDQILYGRVPALTV